MVIDAVTGEPVVNANIALEGKGYINYCSGQHTGIIKHYLSTDAEGEFSELLLYWPNTPLRFIVNAPSCERYVALKSLSDLEPQSHRDYSVQISLTCEHSNAQIQNRSVPDP
jgi:hypothetical protein